MKKIFLILAIISHSGFLVGCSSMNSGFDCPNSASGMCKSLDQINTMVDKGQIQGRSQISSAKCHSSSSDFQPYVSSARAASAASLRSHETVQRIWVAPFEDTEGNYHQDSLIYTVVKKGHWSGNSQTNSEV